MSTPTDPTPSKHKRRKRASEPAAAAASTTRTPPTDPPPSKRRTRAAPAAAASEPAAAPTARADVAVDFYVLDEGRPQVFTLYEDDGTEHEIDSGEDLSAVVQQFLEIGWQLHGQTWTYVDRSGRARHCQSVACFENSVF